MGNFSPLISSRPSSTFTVALPDTKRGGGGLLLCRYQRSIVASAVFDQRVSDYFTTKNAKRQL